MYYLFPEFSSLPGVTEDSDKGALFGESHPNNKIHPHLDGLLCPSRHMHERQCVTGGGFPARGPSAHGPLSPPLWRLESSCQASFAAGHVQETQFWLVRWAECPGRTVLSNMWKQKGRFLRTIYKELYMFSMYTLMSLDVCKHVSSSPRLWH